MSNWQYVSIGSGNGLAPNRRQAIIWTNADLVPWRFYVALGGDELKNIFRCVLQLQLVTYPREMSAFVIVLLR